MSNASPVAARPAENRPPLFTGAFVALSLASLAYFVAAGMLIPAVPLFVEGPLGGGNAAVGIVFGLFSVTAVLVRPAAGLFSDRRGRRPLLLAGAALVGVSVLAYGMVSTTAALGLLRLVGGAGEALFFVAMVTTFSDLAPPERRGEAMSLASLALYLGIGLGPVAAEQMVSWWGLGSVWVGAAAAAFLAVVLVLRVPETRPEAVAPLADGAARTQRLIHPAGLLPGVVLLTSIVGMGSFLVFVPLHARDIGLGRSGVVLLLFAGVVVLVRSIGARLPDVLGPGRAIRAALSLSVLGLGTVAVWHGVAGLVLGAVVLGVGVSLLTPSVFALAATRAPASERGQVMATTSAFIDVALGLGPISMGLVAAWFGRPAVFAAGAVAAAAGLTIVVATRLGASSPEPLPVPAGGVAAG